MKRILLVEDDTNLGLSLASVLEMQGFEVKYLTRGEGVLDEFNRFGPDLVILDVMLNDTLDGFDIARLIRAVNNTPVIFTTSREGNDDFREGFAIGNADYVRKPYRVGEVMVRLDSLLARQGNGQKDAGGPLRVGRFDFVPAEQCLKFGSEHIHMTNYETGVLQILCKNKDTYMTRDNIIKQVWQLHDSKLKEASLNNVLSNLRKYLSKDPDIRLETKIRLGVKLMLPAAEMGEGITRF